MPKTCSGCQQQNVDNAVTCAACGLPFSETAPSAQPRQTGPALPKSAPSTQPGAPAPDSPERELWAGRASYGALLGQWILYGIAVIAVLVLYLMNDSVQHPHRARFFQVLLLLVIFPPGLWLLGRTLFLRWGIGYRLTEQRLFIERGLLSRTTDQIELIRVDDVRIRQGAAQRLLGLGDVIVISSDALNRETVIAGIKDPAAVAEHVRTSMRRLRTAGAVYVQQV